MIDSTKSLDLASTGSENPRMAKSETGPLYLRRVDSAQNMRRFYLLSIQPTLFGGASVIRNWGRIGAHGQAMMQTFDENVDADRAFAQLARNKGKRGYIAK